MLALRARLLHAYFSDVQLWFKTLLNSGGSKRLYAAGRDQQDSEPESRHHLKRLHLGICRKGCAQSVLHS